jgi:hypothetical protein
MIPSLIESPWVHNDFTCRVYFQLSPVLDPNFKLIYFLLAQWNHIWISTAKDITRAEYDRKYAPKPRVTAKPVSYVDKVCVSITYRVPSQPVCS